MLLLATKLVSNKKSEIVRNAILSALEPFFQAVRSIMLDNSTHSPNHKTIANRLNATVYFAHPHCLGSAVLMKISTASFGSIFQRKPRLLTPLHISLIADKNLTTSPRKCLCFVSPAASFFSELNSLHFSVDSAVTESFIIQSRQI